ncbi:TPA: flagellar type III secretion system pore protein FliP [Vibrio cholerae]|uniref:flagellar type III secretion system pore protein FliP n=1 Tax=Vibrio cholerae TaxID=666 RepID=UPI000E0AE281|nr:flagellar type III secretion system pore protein FliP [Vibrio cholerae]EGQ8315796.1 flagellar type III secretion system pore protein FliP [Vibrio cholerae]EGR1860475.1 flagellar biosynthesis protein FliP [Vibrio cholerae]EJY0883534.1 flagellar type III secretion system pore protein FliP [Vibrio cholerae]MCR9795118.1 flagellar type III secretion system pore protein FliP [Vibrio cholerae]MCX9442765.1 flagellar type III secretion system pore protein FliP [Vibrio cholerae]
MELDLTHPIIQSFLLLSASAFIPILLVSATCFTRYVIVISLLRTALGLQQTPPNIVVISIALFMTVFTMTPVYHDVKESSYDLYKSGELTQSEAIDSGITVFSEFIISKTSEKDYYFIQNLRNQEDRQPDAKKTVLDDLATIIPAFMLSELKAAFQFAFVIFLPFLLIDLVVASVLMALGMIMLPPISISLPIKLLIFVLIDGWTLLVGSLIRGF